jgi:hypothetical protein
MGKINDEAQLEVLLKKWFKGQGENLNMRNKIARIIKKELDQRGRWRNLKRGLPGFK